MKDIHPVVRDIAILPTRPLEELAERLDQWLLSRLPGGIVLGSPAHGQDAGDHSHPAQRTRHLRFGHADQHPERLGPDLLEPDREPLLPRGARGGRLRDARHRDRGRQAPARGRLHDRAGPVRTRLALPAVRRRGAVAARHPDALPDGPAQPAQARPGAPRHRTRRPARDPGDPGEPARGGTEPLARAVHDRGAPLRRAAHGGGPRAAVPLVRRGFGVPAPVRASASLPTSYRSHRAPGGVWPIRQPRSGRRCTR